MLGAISTQIEEGVGKIEFYSPASNACDPALLAQLAKAFEDFTHHPEVKIILLSSKGEKAFCAGASIKHLAAVKTLIEATEFFSGFGKLLLAMKNAQKIIVTLVQGKAVGGGVGIIAASDYVLGTEKSELKLSELQIGIGPLVIAPAIIRKIGVAAYSSLSLQPQQWQSAAWAYQKGLFNQLLSPEENLLETGFELAKNLANHSERALTEMKASLWQGTENWETLLFSNAAKTAQLSLTPNAQEFFKQFNC